MSLFHHADGRSIQSFLTVTVQIVMVPNRSIPLRAWPLDPLLSDVQLSNRNGTVTVCWALLPSGQGPISLLRYADCRSILSQRSQAAV